jgi:protein-S-isoprenylcysteine O-methyltransferase Ste14
MRLLPPFWFFVALGLMLALHAAWPVAALIGWPWRWLGLPLAAFGGWGSVHLSNLYERVGTTIKPDLESSVLLTDGFYRVSRNPMYVTMSLLLLGIGVLLGTASALAVPPLYALLLDLRFVRVEERLLAARFGDEYAAYRAKVRRWL